MNKFTAFFFRIFLFFVALVGFLFSGMNCRSACEKYKELVCSDPNSSMCHESMGAVGDLSEEECRNKIIVIKSVHEMQEMEKDFQGK